MVIRLQPHTMLGLSCANNCPSNGDGYRSRGKRHPECSKLSQVDLSMVGGGRSVPGMLEYPLHFCCRCQISGTVYFQCQWSGKTGAGSRFTHC